MSNTTTVPPRASKPVASATIDVDQEYDDKLDTTPPSALRFRGTKPQPVAPPHNTGPIVTRIRVERRVSGWTRVLLWVLLALCVLFLINGLVLPAINDVLTHFKYGDSKIATYNLASKHWITELNNGRVRVVVSNEDGSHSQQLTTVISGAPKHALVSLSEDGNKVDVSVNGAYVLLMVSDGKGGYTWEAH